VARWKVVHKPGAWLRQEPNTKGGQLAFLKTGEIFGSTGRMEGLWVERCEKKSGEHWENPRGWVLTDGKEVNLGKLCEPVEFYEDPELEESVWENYRRYFRCENVRDARYAGGGLDKDIQLKKLALPPHCEADVEGKCNYARWQGDCWRCPTCGHEERDEDLVYAEQALGRLAEVTFFSPEIVRAEGIMRISQRTGQLWMVEQDFMAGALDIADAVVSVLGHRHWSVMWAVSIQNLAGGCKLVKEPALDLYLLWTWIEAMNLAQGPAPWLYERCERMVGLMGLQSWGDPVAQTLIAELRRRVNENQPLISVLLLRNYVMDGLVNFG